MKNSEVYQQQQQKEQQREIINNELSKIIDDLFVIIIADIYTRISIASKNGYSKLKYKVQFPEFNNYRNNDDYIRMFITN